MDNDCVSSNVCCCFALIAFPLTAGIKYLFIVAQLAAVTLLVKGYVDLFNEFNKNLKAKKAAKLAAKQEEITTEQSAENA